MRTESERLIHELLDGTIDKRNCERLRSILRVDPVARRTYYSLLCVDQMLIDAYALPDHVTTFQTLSSSFRLAKRIQGNPVLWSLGIAAAILIVTLFTLSLIRIQPSRANIAGSADSRYLLDGRFESPNLWARGQQLDVMSGVVVARLNSATEACVEGPATLTLMNNDGDVELSRGKAFFRVSPGAPPFKVRVAGATLRHIGTQFGVAASDESSCEVHVASGSVEVDRHDGTPPSVLRAGEAVKWKHLKAHTRTDMDISGFQQSLPREALVFYEDFSDPEGTHISKKKPNVGQQWMVLADKQTTVIGDGRLDTSGGSRNLSAGFRSGFNADSRRVTMLSFSTLVPRKLDDKQSRLGGVESIILWGADGRPICSVVARARDNHLWRIRNDMDDVESETTDLSALGENELTVRVDAVSGKITLHEGASAQAEIIAEVPFRGNAQPVSLTVFNDDGGDLSLRRISVRNVHYGS